MIACHQVPNPLAAGGRDEVEWSQGPMAGARSLPGGHRGSRGGRRASASPPRLQVFWSLLLVLLSWSDSPFLRSLGLCCPVLFSSRSCSVHLSDLKDGSVSSSLRTHERPSLRHAMTRRLTGHQMLRAQRGTDSASPSPHGTARGVRPRGPRVDSTGPGGSSSLCCVQTQRISSMPRCTPEHSLPERGQSKKDFCSH